MTLELYIQNSNNNEVYNVSDIATQIKVKQSLDGNAGQLTCTLQKDPNNILKLANGSIVSFIVDKTGFFFGYIFKISTDSDGNYAITAYDQMRYLKNSDVYTISNMTSSQVFEKICKDYGLKYKVNVPSYYKPDAYLYSNKTLYIIIKRGMDLANINEKAHFFIIDRFGTLTWSEVSYEKTNYLIGDDSLLTSFKYEKSIDSDTYNQIKLYRDNKDTNKRDIWLVRDSSTIGKWGTLQLLKKADDDANAAQVRQSAENYLKVKNRETETLKLSGDGILELTPGKGIRVVISREGIDKWMWIKASTHIFTKYEHTMELEVEV